MGLCGQYHLDDEDCSAIGAIDIYQSVGIYLQVGIDECFCAYVPTMMLAAPFHDPAGSYSL
jgi:hypothetical protein